MSGFPTRIRWKRLLVMSWERSMSGGIKRKRTVRAIVNVTSDKCYENREWPRGYREMDSLGGYDPTAPRKDALNSSPVAGAIPSLI